MAVQPGQGGQSRPGLGPITVEHRHIQCVRVVQAVGGHAGQHPVGAQLDEGGDAVRDKGAHTVGEANGAAHVVHPVTGVGQLGGGGLLAGGVGDHRDGGRVVLDRQSDLEEFVEHPVHSWRVEGVTDVQPPGGSAPGLPALDQLRHRVLVAGHDHGSRAVDRGDAHLVRAVLQQVDDLGLVCLQRCHGATRRQCLHQACPGDHHGTGVDERQHPGDVRSDEFAERVAEQPVRSHTPRVQQREQRGLDGEQAGLGELGGVQQRRLRRAGVGEHDLPQRP